MGLFFELHKQDTYKKDLLSVYEPNHVSPISFLILYMVRSNGFVLPFLKRLNVPGETFKIKAAFSNVRFFSSKKSLNAILNLSMSSELFILGLIMALQV